MTGTVPVCATVAVPVAVSWLEETNLVGRNVPPNAITAPFTKFRPLTTRLKLPIAMLVGSTAVTIGKGLLSVTMLVELAVVSAKLVACT